MARTHAEADEATGIIKTKKVGRHKAVAFPVTDNSTRAKRIRRALIG